MKKPDFVKRLVEICNTSHPHITCQKSDITYNIAKNYFNDSLTNISVLIQILEKTSYSIH